MSETSGERRDRPGVKNGSGEYQSAGSIHPAPETEDEMERLRYERDHWRGLFEQVVEEFPQFGFVIDSDEQIAYYNSAAESVLGFQKEDVLGERVYDAFPIPAHEETFAQTVASEGASRRESGYRQIPTADGEKWVRSSGVVLRNPEGEIIGGFETTTDVTSLSNNSRRSPTHRPRSPRRFRRALNEPQKRPNASKKPSKPPTR